MNTQVHIYPIEESSTASQQTFTYKDKDLLENQIKEAFKLPSDATGFGFTFYEPSTNKQKAIPFSALVTTLEALKIKELSVRLCTYPLYIAPENNTQDPWENDTYFGGYSQMHIHWEMLADTRRCSSYKKAIMDNANDFKDKVVMDVGCGTGILSIFCVQAGAKKVYAIDASDVVYQADQIIRANNCQDKIQIIHGKIEELTLPVDKVDIIVSEWMGYFLIFESMLETIIFARDKWLKEGGLMFPSSAKMYISPINYEKYFTERIEFFSKPVEGVILTPMIPYVKEEFTFRCMRATDIAPSELLTEGIVFKEIDLSTLKADDLKITRKQLHFNLGNKEPTQFHGFGTWFDVTFTGNDPNVAPVVLSTHPKFGKTHWRQEVFLYKDTTYLQPNAEITGSILVTQMKEWRRHYQIQITASAGDITKIREWII